MRVVIVKWLEKNLPGHGAAHSWGEVDPPPHMVTLYSANTAMRLWDGEHSHILPSLTKLHYWSVKQISTAIRNHLLSNAPANKQYKNQQT